MSGEKCSDIQIDEGLFGGWISFSATGDSQSDSSFPFSGTAGSQGSNRESTLQKARKFLRQQEAVLDQLAARSDTLLGEFPDLSLSETPLIPEYDESDLDSVREAIKNLRLAISSYQKEQDESLISYHRQQAAREASQQLGDWANVAVAPVRSAADVLRFLDSESGPDKGVQKDAALLAMRQQFRPILNRLSESGLELDATGTRILNALADSKTINEARKLLGQLGQSVDIQINAFRKEAEMKARLEKERLRTGVSFQIANILENMGYEVSGLDESAFTKDGKLYAVKHDYPDHVMVFEVNKQTSALTTSPHRVVEDNITTGAGEEGLNESDLAFDENWCEKDVLAFKKAAAARGVGLKFRRTRNPGAAALPALKASALGQWLTKCRQRKKNRAVPKARTRKPGQ